MGKIKIGIIGVRNCNVEEFILKYANDTNVN